MAQQVRQGATMTCSFGTTPSTLTVTSNQQTGTGKINIATIMDHAPMTNIASFGICSAPTNPQVIAATSAALGVFTPQPCMPATSSPWVSGSPSVKVGGIPALNSTCTLTCQWLGAITITNPGQGTVNTA